MSAHVESRLREILRTRRERDRDCEPFDQPVRPDPSTELRVIPSLSSDELVEGTNGVQGRLVEGQTRLHAAAEALDGDVVESSSGPCVVVDRFYPADHHHGMVRIGDVHGLSMSVAPELRLVGGHPSDPDVAPSPLLFVDLETTGLSGGAGTYAFLVGCAYFEPHGFRIRQFFLSGFQHERPLLGAVDALMRRSAGLVSYNGKSFDVPVLETRYAFNRLSPPFTEFAHVDMLHVARRFWRSVPAAAGAWPETDSCRLSALERVLFGVRRVGDVPGFEIPSRYFDFVRTGNAERLEPVFEHNRLDLLSLALMTARALRLLEDAPSSCTTARESLAAGRILESVGRLMEGERCYRDAIERARTERGGDAGLLRAEALRNLALRCRRDGRFNEAADLWRAIVVERQAPPALRREALDALAIYYEHRARDLDEAHRFARLSLAERVGTRGMDAGQHRLARLDRKMAGHQPGPVGPRLMWQDA
jgi:uncharacterized protein YprB with RNaseH-like and TPR domain